MNKFLVVVSILAVIGVSVFYFNKNSQEDNSSNSSLPTPTIFTPTQEPMQDVTITPMQEELTIEDLKVGTGAEAVVGKTVTVNYKGTLTNGTQFDSSYDRGEPFSFVLGSGFVIKGWDQGVAGMKVGGKRKLTIPSSLGYGAEVTGTIPANSTLIFEIELLKVE